MSRLPSLTFELRSIHHGTGGWRRIDASLLRVNRIITRPPALRRV